MFTAEHYVTHVPHRKARRRYRWAAVCFIAGFWLGYCAGHLF